VTASPDARRSWPAELGRFLEIQNLGLNLPFALAFLLVAAGGLPSLRVFLLVVVAFVAARNAGHAFNRWADRQLDAANPRTRDRALPQGRLAPTVALAITAGSAVVLVAAAYLLNPLAFLLSPVALALVLGYSYTKRVTSLTTGVLGLVEAITPAAAFVAVRGDLPMEGWVAVAAFFAWGTAFEMVHSLGDMESDRGLGLRSLPLRLGRGRSVGLVVVLHAASLALLAVFGALARLAFPFDVGLAAMVAIAAVTDRRLAGRPTEVGVPFRRHFAMGLLFLGGTAWALFGPR
jgi:4-hydroxybenzoate polyprenyltransferase